MSLNGIDGLTNPSNDVDAVTKNYVDNYVNKKLIKILEEGLIEISRHFDQQSYLVRAVVSRLSTIVRKLEEIRKNDSKE